jgi:hypothetical protein
MFEKFYMHDEISIATYLVFSIFCSKFYFMKLLKMYAKKTTQDIHIILLTVFFLILFQNYNYLFNTFLSDSYLQNG